MADIRVYQQSIDVIGVLDTPDLRVYQQAIDVIGTPDAVDLRVYQQAIDVIGTPDAPGLQISQQNIQVLGTKTGDARVSRIYLERLVSWVPGDSTYERGVTDTPSFTDAARYSPRKLPVTDTLTLSDTPLYIGPIDLTASSTLSFTDAARLAGTISVSASSTLTFTDSIVQSGTIPLSVEQTLTTIQFADTSEKIRILIDPLSLTQAASANWIKVVEQPLTLVQTAIGDVGKFVQDSLVLSQEATVRASKHIQSVTHTVSLAESNSVYPHYGRAEHTLDFTQTIAYNIPTSLSVEHELITSEYEIVDGDLVLVYSGLSDEATVQIDLSLSNIDYIQWGIAINVVLIQVNAISVAASSNLLITDRGTTSIHEEVGDSLSFSQSTTEVLTTTASNILTITDEAVGNKTLNLSIISSLDINAAFELIPQDEETCTYDPSIGSSTSTSNPVPRPLSSSFSISRQDDITLEYPWTSPTNSITLRVPELGNRNIVELQRINRRTRGGTLIVWSDPQWPKNEHFVIDIKALTEAKSTELKAFIVLTIGKEIGYTDWENNKYKAVLLNPDTAIKRDGICKMSANLEFEVTRNDPAWTAYNSLSISQTVNFNHVYGEPTSVIDTLPLQQETSLVIL